MTTRALTLLNTLGDLTLTWEPDQDDKMEEIVQQKMSEGVVFFLIEPRMGGLQAPLLTRLEDATLARKHRALSIPDESIAAFVATGNGTVVPTPDTKVKTVRKAKTAKEVVSGESVGVKPLKGG